MGFVSPQEVWQKNELKHLFDDTFNNINTNNINNYYDTEKLKKIYLSYKMKKFNNWSYIWRLFNLCNWFDYNKGQYKNIK
jgi:hypothetical protein